MLQLRYAIAGFSLVACLCTVGDLPAQTVTKVPDAPLPSTLLTAKRVFISFAGGEFDSNWGPRQIYNQFYAEIKARGQYELVRTPGESDLVLQVSFRNPMSEVSVSPGAGGSWGSSSSSPQLQLVLRDPKTSIALWTFVEYVPKAFSPKSRDKIFGSTLHKLASDPEALITQPAPK